MAWRGRRITKTDYITRAIRASVRGRRVLNEGDLETAFKHFGEAVRIEPFSARYHESLGTVFHYMGRHEEPLAELDEAMRLEPGRARYHRSRNITLREMGRLDESLGEIDRAIELDPCHALAHKSRALTLRAMGRVEGVLAEETRVRELSGVVGPLTAGRVGSLFRGARR